MNTNWYRNPKSSHYLKILTDSSYTSQDTLYINSKLKNPEDYEILVGPFENNQVYFLDSMINYFYGSGEYLAHCVGCEKNQLESVIFWNIRYKNFAKLYEFGNHNPRFLVFVHQEVCDVGDTAIIDLRGYKPR